MGDNRKLYDNLLKSGKISEGDIGDFATFDSLLKTPDKANVLYKNLRKGDMFTEEEIGDSATFMSLIEKPVPKVETPETDTEAQSEYQLSFDKKPTLEDWEDKPEKTPQQITAEKTGVSEQFVNVVEGAAKKAVPRPTADERFLKYQRNNIYGGFKSTFPEYSKDVDEIVNMMESDNPNLQMQAADRFNQINQSVTLDPRYPKYKNEFVNPSDVTSAAKSLIDDTNGIKSIAEKLQKQIVPERISTELRIGLENYIKGYTELGKRLDESEQIRNLVSKLKEAEKGNDVKLSEEEGILLQALDENIRTHDEIKSKLPKSYDWATSAGYSLGFMAEFILSRGIVSKIAKPVQGLLTAGKIGGAASPVSLGMLKLMEAGVQPVLMPSMYKMIAEKRAEGLSLGRSFGEAWDENFKEVISEYMFMSPSDKVAKGFLNKFFKLAGVTLNTESGVKGFIKNMAEEYIEEKVAEIYSAPKDHKNFRSFWNQFINKQDNINTFASVAFISGAMSAPIVAMKSYDKVRSDIVLNGLQKRLPKEISSDIDIILKDKTLTNQEIFKLVGETINNRIKDGTIVTDPTVVASDAIKYTVESVKKIVRENVDKAKPEEIFDKEIRLPEPTEKKETAPEVKEEKPAEVKDAEVKTVDQYFYEDSPVEETEATQKIDESESLEDLNKVTLPENSPLQKQKEAKQKQIFDTYELNANRISDLEEAGNDQKRINEIEKEYQKALKGINAKYEESVQKKSTVKEKGDEILAEKKTEISESQPVESEPVIESEPKIETVKEKDEEKVAETKVEEPVSPAPVEQQPIIEESGITQSAARYGWTTKVVDGKTQLINRKGKIVADVVEKKGKYIIQYPDGKKILSGNKSVSEAVEKVIRDVFYGKEEPAPIKEPLPEKKQEPAKAEKPENNKQEREIAKQNKIIDAASELKKYGDTLADAIRGFNEAYINETDKAAYELKNLANSRNIRPIDLQGTPEYDEIYKEVDRLNKISNTFSDYGWASEELKDERLDDIIKNANESIVRTNKKFGQQESKKVKDRFEKEFDDNLEGMRKRLSAISKQIEDKREEIKRRAAAAQKSLFPKPGLQEGEIETPLDLRKQNVDKILFPLLTEKSKLEKEIDYLLLNKDEIIKKRREEQEKIDKAQGSLFQISRPKKKVNFRGFLNKLGLTGKVEGLDKSARVGKINSVNVIIQQGDNESEAIIESIRTPKILRGRGKAQKALTKIINEADKDGITLKLRAVPEEGAKITQQQLIDWYKKNGFEFAENSNRGVRSPKLGMQVADQKLARTPKQIFDAILERLFGTKLAKEIITDKAQIEEKLKQYGIKKLADLKRQAEPTLKLMATTQGEVYGFTTPDGKIYIDPDLMNVNTPIHEYGHLWIGWAKNNAPELFEKGLKLADAKTSPYFKEIWENESYANLRQQYEAGDKEAFLEEVLATAIGDKGEQFVNSKIKSDFKQWLIDLFKAIKEALGISQYTAKQLQDITFDEFSKAVAIELLKGEEIANKGGTQNAIQKQKSDAEMLRSEQSELGLQGMGARNAKHEKPTGKERKVGETLKTKEEIRFAAKPNPKLTVKQRLDEIKKRGSITAKEKTDIWGRVRNAFNNVDKLRQKVKDTKKGFAELSDQITDMMKEMLTAKERKFIYPGQYNAIINRLGKATTVKAKKKLIDYVRDTVILGNGAKYKAALADARKGMDKIIKANKKDKSKFSDVKAAEEAIKIDLTQLSLEELKEFTKLVNKLFYTKNTPRTEYLHIINDTFGDKHKEVKAKVSRIKDIDELQQFVDDTSLIEITDVDSYVLFNRRLNLARKRAIDIFGQLADTPDNQTAQANIEAKIGDIQKRGEEIGGEFQEQLEKFRLAYADHLSSLMKSQETKDGIDNLGTAEEKYAANVLYNTPVSAIRKLNISEMSNLHAAIDNLRISELAPYTFHDLMITLNAIDKNDKFLHTALSNINKTARWRKLLDRGMKAFGWSKKQPFIMQENESQQLLFELMKLQSFRMDLFLGNISMTKTFGRIFSETGQAINKQNRVKADTDKQLYDAYQIFARGKRKNKFWKFQYAPDEQLGWRKIIGMWMIERRWQSSEFFDEEKLTKDNASFLDVVFNKGIVEHRQAATDSKSFDEDVRIYNLFLQLARENDAFKKIGDIEVLDIDKLETVLRSDPGIDALIRTIDNIFKEYEGMHKMATLFNGRGVKFGTDYFPMQSKDRRLQIDDGNILTELLKVESGARLQTGSTHQWTGAKMYVETDVTAVVNSYTEGVRRNYFLYPLLRENVKAIKMAAKQVADENVKTMGNDNRMDMLGNTIAKALVERVSMYYNTGKYHRERSFFDILEKGSKKALLAKPAKTVTETTANIIRMIMVMKELPTDAYVKIKQNKEFYNNFISEFIGDKYFSRWADEVNDTIYKSTWLKYAEEAADFFITFADKSVGKAMFVAYFTEKFKEITGNEFSEIDYQNNPNYRFKYKEAIDDATTMGLRRVEELFNNKNPLSNAQYVSFFNGLVSWRSDKPMTRVMNFLMSFGRNEANQIVDSVRRYRWSGRGSTERIMAKRDIMGVVTSNFMYGVLRKMMSITEEIILAQVSGLFGKGGGDDDKYIDKQKQQLLSGKFYWDYATKRIALDLILAGSANIYESAATFSLFLLEGTHGLDKETLEYIYEQFNVRYMDRLPLYGMTDRVLIEATPSGLQPVAKDFFSVGQSLFDIVDSIWDAHEKGFLSQKDVYDLVNICNVGMKYVLFNPAVPIIERKVNQNMYKLRKEHAKQEKEWKKQKETGQEQTENQTNEVIKM